jgi:hypothetical protein
MSLSHGRDVSSSKNWPLPLAGEGQYNPLGVWDTNTLSWVKMTQPATSGGGVATIADGGDAAEGATTDAAITSNATGTLSGKLRGLVAIAASVWDSVNGRLKVDGSAVTQPVSLSSSSVTMDHALTFAGDKADVSGSSVVVSSSALPSGAATDAVFTAATGSAADRPAANTVSDRLYRLGVKLDNQNSVMASEATQKQVLAALNKLVAPAPRPIITLLHGR